MVLASRALSVYTVELATTLNHDQKRHCRRRNDLDGFFSVLRFRGRAGSGFYWDSVNHAAGEFAKRVYRNRVSSNAMESISSRVRAKIL